MAIRAPWEDAYCFAFNTGAIDANAPADVPAVTGVFAGTAGLTLTTNGLMTDEHPDILAGVETTTTEKATGLSQTKTGASGVGQELHIGRKLPTFSTGAMGLTEEKLVGFLWSLFQKGASEAVSTPFSKTFIPYVQGAPDIEMFLAIGRSIGDPSTGTVGKAMYGGVVTTWGMNYASGERLTFNADMIGAYFTSAYNHAASNFTFDTIADHQSQDYTFTFGGTAASVSTFDLSIVNNVTPKYYNSVFVTQYVLGRIAATGTINLALSTTTIGDHNQLDSYVSGVDTLMVMDHTNATKFFTTKINMHYTGAEIDPAEELMYTLPYEGVFDGTNHAVELQISDAIDRTIP